MKLNQLTLSNIKGYIQANFRDVIDSFGELPSYLKEQAQWRLNQVKAKSPACYKKDKCEHCGCQVSAKVLEDRGCSDNEKCYGKMMNETEWEWFKLSRNVEMFALFGKEGMFDETLKSE